MRSSAIESGRAQTRPRGAYDAVALTTSAADVERRTLRVSVERIEREAEIDGSARTQVAIRA